MAGLIAPSGSMLLTFALIFLFLNVRGVAAFGAGNIAGISKIEGQNWRHGDIEDTLLAILMTRARGGKKFSKLDVKRVYFGNWLRDYSQAVDVGTVKMVSAEAIRLLLWILGFLSFGFGTKEFEVTTERLGCYRPEEHIDNPKDYADNIDARQYDPRLRAPVDERRELAIDERTGLKAYIASEDRGITTSAGMVRDLYRRCIQLGREYKRSNNKDDLYEAFRLLGTANHCLEDYSAHSNYTELCLIEMGERDVFPHVGRRGQVNVQGRQLWPLITGTFGGVDFLHSVMGELSDKASQSEIDELEGSISSAEANRNQPSIVKNLLEALPSGLFGGKDESSKVDELQQNANNAQMQNMTITPKSPEEFTQQAELIRQQIYPALEFHDEVMRSINQAVEKIPVLPEMLDQLSEAMSIFVFSLIAPVVLPLIKQIKAELSTGSSEVIASSREKQLIVFKDDECTDPTHSMISKDHFSNVLNEPAGKVASQVLKWVVPQIVECWDDEGADAERNINRIINGVFHHPALRDGGEDGARDCHQQMFQVVEDWWRGLDERARSKLRGQLSREGVEQGKNHKEGVHDGGHGCGKPLGPGGAASGASGAIAAGMMGALNEGLESQGLGEFARPVSQSQQSGRRNDGKNQDQFGIGKMAGEAAGGGLLGGIVGGLVGGVGSSLLGGAFKGDDSETNSYKQESQGNDGSYTQSYTETGRKPAHGYGGQDQYGQAEYKKTEYPSGGRKEEYSRYEQDGNERPQGYGFQQSVETQPTYGGGYERTEERRTERPGGGWESERRTENVSGGGHYSSSESRRHGGGRDDDDDDRPKHHGGRQQESYRREEESGGYGGRQEQSSYGRQEESGGYGGRQEQSSYGRQEESGGYGGRQEQSSYGRQEESVYGRQQDSSSYGRQEQSGGYGGRRSGEYGRRGGDDGDEDDNRRERRHGGGEHGRRRGGDDDEDVDEYGERRRRY
ncbi:Het-C-domain-containing protein [Venturia nashicola]|uniref:Het-C-domain-containing protein n=1 Tax=Venturia nashicola TaxID=86259 RepID=A0A4Z1PFU6_9PEZI|nr:Het-C-domain-containing protein [Venturia nashicola]TLD38471.1 Het-C-domain-containing protein [Venturia nashicola]